MPIDDIDYLLKHSQEESIIMMIDSRKRDKVIYPNPGEFEVIFDEPIQNVSGIEVLDTSIPRTMFMTDTHNNSLRVFSGLINKRYIEDSSSENFLPTIGLFNSSDDYIDYKFAEQDYQSADSAFLALNDQMIMSMMQVDNFDMTYFPVERLYERGKSSYPIIRFSSPNTPFALDTANSTSRTMLGFCTRAETKGGHKGKFFSLKDMYRNDQSVCTNLWRYKHNKLNLEGTVFPAGRRTNDKVFIPRSHANIRRQATNVLTIPYRHHSRLSLRSFFSGIGLVFPRGTFAPSVLDYVDEISFSMYVVRNVDGMARKLFYLESVAMKSLEEDRATQVIYPNKLNYGMLFEYLEFAHKDLNVEYIIEIEFHKRNYANLVDLFQGVYVEYAYFINTTENKHFNEHTYFSVPIFNYEDTQKMHPSPDHEYVVTPTGTYYAQKIDPRRNTPTADANKDYYVGKIPLSSSGTYQEVLKYNPMCNGIDIKIPLNNNKELLVDDIVDIYFIDIYENNELYVRVYLDAKIEAEDSLPILRLNYTASEEELKTNSGNNIYLGKHLLNSKRFNILNEEIDEANTELNLEFQLFFQSRLFELPLENATFAFKFLSVDTFAIQSPGMMNLATESYIMLRSEELENHLRGSFDMRNTSPGLGVVNIDVQGYAVNRLEFFSVKYKQFHPIGTLAKMKLRFERCTDGQIYDFKNVDLHMLVSFKFLRPKQLEKFQESRLNPDYNPDFMGYLNRDMAGVEDDSTDEDDFEEEYFQGRLRQLEI